jgi:hypothetical protein
MLRSKLAAGTRCALEHGGAALVIVDDGADLSVMIPKLIKGGFYHSGQVCVSVQRIFAPKAQAEQIAGLLAESARKLVLASCAAWKSRLVGPTIVAPLALCQSDYLPLSEPAQAIKEILLELIAELPHHALAPGKSRKRGVA